MEKPHAPVNGKSIATTPELHVADASEEGEVAKPARVHPIAKAINTFLHSISDFEALARIYIPLSKERRIEKFEGITKEIEESVVTLKERATDRRLQIAVMSKALDAVRRFERLRRSNATQRLRSSLFVGMFSAYDIFTGDLLAAIYEKKPELFYSVDRSISVSEILEHSSFDELKTSVLHQEIEEFRRQGYVDQFEELERTFGVPLKKFENWPKFVECSQRRNLITHADGIVNEQYSKICVKEGFVLPENIRLGEKLTLDSDYFAASCDLLMEVGCKLGQTLWRKIFPDEIETADRHLTMVIYDECLKMERWPRAIVFGDFAVNQKRFSSDANHKIFVINYAIGLKFSGESEAANRALSAIDWSGAAVDFKLAEAVLTDKYDDAAEIMKRIGKEGELLEESHYHEWPLFYEFRKTSQFLDAYENVYGYPFAAELERVATKAQAESSKEIERQTSENETVVINENDVAQEN